MSTTSGKREARPKTTARADQLRQLNVPRSVEVELNNAGLPSIIADSCNAATLQRCRSDSDAEQSETAESDTVGKAVESIIEIWHVDDEWWREPISRRYVEVILEGGKHVVLYEDLITSDWFMQNP
jgi:hypothetical protein